MKSKLFYLIIGTFIFLILYFFIFIKSKTIEDPNLLSMCKKGDKIEIDLLDSFHYIDRYEIKENKDTLQLDIYLTTIGNFIDQKKMTKFYIANNKTIKIKNKIINLSDLQVCQ